MKKLKSILIMSVAIIALSGCGGSTFDLSTSPDTVFQSGGIVKAVEWCDKRDSDVGFIKPLSDTIGAVVDVGVAAGAAVATPFAHIISAAPDFARSVVDSNTAARNTQCGFYRNIQNAEKKSASQSSADDPPDDGSQTGDEVSDI